MKDWYTAAEFAALGLPGLPETKSGVIRWAERKGWAEAVDRIGRPLARKRDGAGGGMEYHRALLPQLAQSRLAADELKDFAELPAGQTPEPPSADTRRRDARLVILSLASAHARTCPLARHAADELFALAWCRGKVAAEPWILDEVPTLSARSLKRWRNLTRTGEAHALAGRYKRHSRSPLARPEISTHIAALMVAQPHLTADHIRDLVADKFDLDAGSLPSIRSFQRAMERVKADHGHALVKLTDPDRYRGSLRIAGGDMNAHVVRLNQLWEIDASPADVLLRDGRHSLYVVIDIWSRRMMALVTRTPRTQAALTLTRRAILDWGVPDVLRTDNGSDFVSRHARQALVSLGIEHDVAPPFDPARKGTVERGIGTLQRGLMPLLPGFIGHSVADRKTIEARKAFAARLGESPEDTFCVDMEADELQRHLDVWLASKYAHKPHAGLARQTPFARAASWTGPVRRIDNIRALDLLLSPAADGDGWRTVTKRGVRLDGTHFLAPELLAGARVFVRLDPDDMGRIYCFDGEAGAFVAEAIAPERLGIDPAAAVAEARARQVKLVKDATAEIRAEAKRIKPRDMIDAVTRQAAKNAGTLAEFPRPSEPHTTPSLEQAAIARAEARQPSYSDEQRAAHAALVAEHASRAETVVALPESPKQRFARAVAIQRLIDAGEDVAADDARWLGSYEQTAEFRAHAKMLEDFGPEWLGMGPRTVSGDQK